MPWGFVWLYCGIGSFVPRRREGNIGQFSLSWLRSVDSKRRRGEWTLPASFDILAKFWSGWRINTGNWWEGEKAVQRSYYSFYFRQRSIGNTSGGIFCAFLKRKDFKMNWDWRAYTALDTIHPNYRQAVFSITLNFPLEFTQDGLPELGSSFKEIFLVALFEKNPKLIIFHSILHPHSRGLLENLFR